jgi:hypothetical protein
MVYCLVLFYLVFVLVGQILKYGRWLLFLITSKLLIAVIRGKMVMTNLQILCPGDQLCNIHNCH